MPRDRVITEALLITVSLGITCSIRQEGAYRRVFYSEIYPPELYLFHAPLKIWSRNHTKESWQTEWQHETRGRASFRNAPVPERILQLHEGLSKRQGAILVQLRTERIGLRDFLFRRRVPGILDPMCNCREGRQTEGHVLLTCRKLRDLRKQEFGHLPEHNNRRVILSKRKAAIQAINFIERSQILGRSRVEEE